MVRWPEPASAQPIQSSTPRRASRFAAAERSPNCAAARWPHSVLVSVTASVLRFWSMLSIAACDAGVADDLGPARDVGLDPRVHFVRRAADRLIALQAELRDHVRRLQRLVGLGVEPRDRGLWRAGWRRESIPAGDLETRDAAFDHGRQRPAPARSASARPPPAREFVRPGRAAGPPPRGPNIICTWPPTRSVRRLRRALVGHVQDVDAGGALEELGGKMQRRADAGRAHRSACRDWPWRRRSARRRS